MRRRFGAIARLCILLMLGTTEALWAQDQPSASADESQGAALFASNCAVCHGADGRGGEHAPDIATASDVQRVTDQNLTGIIKNGITGTGMPGFAELGQKQILALVRTLRTLQGKNSTVTLPGNPEHGEALFFGKAQCSECHMAQGKGGFIAADLSYSNANTDASHLRQVILEPQKALPAQKKAVSLTTNTGQKFTGALRAQDNFSITIQSIDGAFHYFPTSELASVDVGSRSLMPDNYRSRLSDTEVNDLVSYLIRIGSQSAKPDDASSDEDDE